MVVFGGLEAVAVAAAAVAAVGGSGTTGILVI